MSTHNPPLKPLPLSRSNSMQFAVFYTKEGEISDKFIPLCEELKIPTKDLLIKSLQNFAGPNISDKVQTQKFNQYEANRVCKRTISPLYLTLTQAKLEFLRTLALERRLIKAKKDREININEPRTHRSQGVTPRGGLDYKEGFSPSLVNTPSSNQYLEQTRQDGNRSVGDKKLNFFFTELPDTITGSQTNRMRDYVSESLTPMSLSNEKKKTRQYVTFDKLSTSRKGDKTTRTSRNSSLEHEGMNTKNKFMQNFDKVLEERIKKSERMFNASATLLRQQDENRSRLTDMWAKKEEKWQQAMRKLEIKKKGKVSKIEEIQRTRSEKRLELHQVID